MRFSVQQSHYTADLQWNRVSNLKPSSSEAEILPLGHCGLGVEWRLCERLPAQMSPSSSDHGSKLRARIIFSFSENGTFRLPEANEILSKSWQPRAHLQAIADNFVFVISEPTGAKLKSTAHEALVVFKRWTDKHKLSVSTEKSCNILISKLVSGPSIKWAEKIIKSTTSFKYLGVTIDNKLNWAGHLCNLKTKITHLHQNIRKIAGANWGLNKAYRRRLYITVAERMVLHGAAVWAYPLSARQERQLNSLQRNFLLNISEAYSTTPKVALQVIEGLLPLHLKAEQEAVYVRVTRLGKARNLKDQNFDQDFED
ncbi:Putative protein in type-1 retrotransposable element R1DM [Araneus ventricosus]|uniref:Reverse transcriptase domain-containing protein n=1 Tax=Araneus ventricosus TaxID=182803 RepID=A0A4Y2E5H3_ARAVE|nr:Putative protein in type-1 retrotransposable element R1DM [Araneus ventricosus]